VSHSKGRKSPRVASGRANWPICRAWRRSSGDVRCTRSLRAVRGCARRKLSLGGFQAEPRPVAGVLKCR
jgi:hypothetical protein